MAVQLELLSQRMWIGWQGADVDVVLLQDSAQYMHCRVVDKSQHLTCFVTFVYGLHSIVG